MKERLLVLGERLWDWRFPEFWVGWSALFALFLWSWIYVELSQAHVTNASLALLVAAPASIPALAAPKQVRRTSAMIFALVLAGALVVLWMSWKYFGIEANWALIKRAFWHDARNFLQIHLDEGIMAFIKTWGLLALAVAVSLAAIGALSYVARGAAPADKRSRQSVHGRSDWMKRTEARKLFPETGDLVVGEAYRVDQDTVAGSTFDKADPSTWGQGGKAPLLCMDISDEKTFASSHALFFAGAGGFKTVSSVVPTCLKWRGGMVVLDPSCEILGMVGEYRRHVLGRKIIAIDPKRPDQGFNVLDWIAASATKEQDIVRVASWLMPEKADVEDSTGQTFGGQARNLVAGLIGYVLLEPSSKYPHNLRSVREILSIPKSAFSAKLKEIFEASSSRFVREMVGQFVDMTEATLSGVHFNASGATAWLSIEEFAKLVCDGKTKTADIVAGKHDVFLNIDMGAMNDNPGLARLLVGALTSAVLKAEGQIPHRLLFLLDEASSLGYMKILETVRDGMRKYRITLMLMYQTLAHLNDCFGRYGQQAWLDGVSFVSFASIGDLETARYISGQCGHYTVEVSNSSRQWGLFGNASMRQGETTGLQSRPLIRPEDVLREMRADEQIVLVKGCAPIRCGRAIYFRRREMNSVVGNNPFVRKKS
jgi:type IV secretion system protein VirD4